MLVPTALKTNGGDASSLILFLSLGGGKVFADRIKRVSSEAKKGRESGTRSTLPLIRSLVSTPFCFVTRSNALSSRINLRRSSKRFKSVDKRVCKTRLHKDAWFCPKSLSFVQKPPKLAQNPWLLYKKNLYKPPVCYICGTCPPAACPFTLGVLSY